MRKVLCTEFPKETTINVQCYQNPPKAGDEVSVCLADGEWTFVGYGEVLSVKDWGYVVEWEPPVVEDA